jgi:hypothetical protein
VLLVVVVAQVLLVETVVDQSVARVVLALHHQSQEHR